ncbi:hypothetical protein ACPPVQ_05250 [Diaminobutyricibacter sp. McL0618]|uniref:hypothetical protein n=1 Tax=Leifsonia sp. McL0618 TaxID=3415677 RepID=UPI003CE72C7E
MSRSYSRAAITAGLIALSIGGVTSAGALSAQAADASASGSATASTAGAASDASAAAAAVDDGASTPNGSPVGTQSPQDAEGTAVDEQECADLEDFEVYDLTETGFKLRWTLPDNHPEYVSFFMDGLGAYVVPVGDFPYTEAIGHHIKPGTRYLVGIGYICPGGAVAGTPILTFTTPGVAPEPEFDWEPGATASMNASAATGAEAAANATANSIGSASASAAASASASASAEGSENASAASDVDIPTVDPASEQTSNAIANAAGARTDAALDQAKVLANTGQDVGGLQVVSVGLVATGLIALVGSLAYQLRNRRA